MTILFTFIEGFNSLKSQLIELEGPEVGHNIITEAVRQYQAVVRPRGAPLPSGNAPFLAAALVHDSTLWDVALRFGGRWPSTKATRPRARRETLCARSAAPATPSASL